MDNTLPFSYKIHKIAKPGSALVCWTKCCKMGAATASSNTWKYAWMVHKLLAILAAGVQETGAALLESTCRRHSKQRH